MVFRGGKQFRFLILVAGRHPGSLARLADGRFFSRQSPEDPSENKFIHRADGPDFLGIMCLSEIEIPLFLRVIFPAVYMVQHILQGGNICFHLRRINIYIVNSYIAINRRYRLSF